MKPLLGAACLLAVGVGIGFAVGRFTAHEAHSTAIRPDPSAPLQARPASNPNGPERPARRGRDPSGIVHDGLDELRKAMHETDLVAGAQQFSAALQDLISADDAAVAAKSLWAKPGRSTEIEERKRLLGYRWGQLGGAQAVDFALAQSGPGKIAVITAAVAGWASVDPSAAKEWMDRQAESGMAGVLAGGLVEGWARQDLVGVTGFVLGLPPDESSEQLMRTVAGEQLRQNTGGALSWALALPDNSLKAAAIDEVAAQWAWADPAAVLAQATLIPDSAQMQAATATAMGIWTRTDPEAASTYLTMMPDGTARDQAVAAFSQSGAAEDPAASAVWAATISDSTMRTASLVSIGTAWLRRDPATALAWLPRSGLSAEAQARLSSPFRRER